MRVVIYQMVVSDVTRYARFDSLDNLRDVLSEYGMDVNGDFDDLYREVYEFDYDNGLYGDEYDILEDVFSMFNTGRRPKDFRGHSLSVSDVVEIEGTKYYCDDFGFVSLDEE